MDQRKPGPVGTSPVVLSSVVHSVDLGEPCRQKKVCDLSSVTPCSGQWSLRAAAVRAAQGVGSHLAGPAVHAFPQLSPVSRALTRPEPVASLGGRVPSCQGNKRWEARASGKQLSCCNPRDRAPGQADPGLWCRTARTPASTLPPRQEGGAGWGSITHRLVPVPPSCLLQPRPGSRGHVGDERLRVAGTEQVTKVGGHGCGACPCPQAPPRVHTGPESGGIEESRLPSVPRTPCGLPGGWRLWRQGRCPTSVLRLKDACCT